MPDAANAPDAGQWRPAGVFRRFLDDMDDFWQSPEGQQLHAAQQAAEARRQAGWPSSLWAR